MRPVNEAAVLAPPVALDSTFPAPRVTGRAPDFVAPATTPEQQRALTLAAIESLLAFGNLPERERARFMLLATALRLDADRGCFVECELEQ